MNANLKLIANWFLANKLAINLVKTEAMVLHRKKIYFPLPPIILNNIPLVYSFTFKFLGLIVDNKLNWKYHISAITSKLSSVCGIMFRVKNRVTRSISKLIYNSLAHPHLIYCNIIWSSTYNSLLYPLRVKQRRLIRLIMKKNRFEHTTPLFKQLNILKLDDVCKTSALQIVYKSLNNILQSPIHFTLRNENPYNTRYTPPLLVPFCRSRQTSFFIHVKGSNLWNELPLMIRNSRSLYTFKRKLKKYIIDSYV